MEKENIEASDLRFRQKVEELRTQLECRRQTYVRKRKVGFRVTLMILGTLAVVTAAGYYLREQTAFREPTVSPVASAKPVSASAPSQASSSTQPCTPQPRALAQGPATRVDRLAPLPPTALAVMEEPRTVEPAEPLSPLGSPPVPTVVEEPPSMEPPAPAVEVVQALPAVEPFVVGQAAVPQLPVESPVSSSMSMPPVPSPVPNTVPFANPAATVVARAEPVLPTPAPPRTDFRITASRACLDVVARECVGAQAVFALHEHNVPHVWMTVHSENLPYVLKHVYYHEGERYAEVPLGITYPRMRTWSNVTLRSPTHVGAWRVEIVAENGTVVEQVEFRVTP